MKWKQGSENSIVDHWPNLEYLCCISRRVDTIREKDDNDILFRIAHDRGSGKSCMEKRAHRCERA